MTSRTSIAVATCFLTSGLFIASGSGAIALADPSPSGVDAPTPSSSDDPVGRIVRTLIDGIKSSPQEGGGPILVSPPSQVGNGRGGLPSDGTVEDVKGIAGTDKENDATANGTGKAGDEDGSKADETTAASPGGTAPAGKDPASAESESTAPEPTAPLPPTETSSSAADTGGQTAASSSNPQSASPVSSPPDSQPVVGQWWPMVSSGVQARIVDPLTLVVLPRFAERTDYVLGLPPGLTALLVQPLIDSVNGLATAAADLPFFKGNPDGAPSSSTGSGRQPSPSEITRPRIGPLPTLPSAPELPIPSSVEPPAAPPAQSPAPESPTVFAADYTTEPAETFRAGYGDFLRAAGVGEVAAVAVPGFTGILVLVSAGGLIGYRQARAGSALRTGAPARFVS